MARSLASTKKRGIKACIGVVTVSTPGPFGPTSTMAFSNNGRARAGSSLPRIRFCREKGGRARRWSM